MLTIPRGTSASLCFGSNPPHWRHTVTWLPCSLSFGFDSGVFKGRTLNANKSCFRELWMIRFVFMQSMIQYWLVLFETSIFFVCVYMSFKYIHIVICIQRLFVYFCRDIWQLTHGPRALLAINALRFRNYPSGYFLQRRALHTMKLSGNPGWNVCWAVFDLRRDQSY